jgi:membrane protein
MVSTDIIDFQLSPAEHQVQLRRAVIEWYDFFLYSTVTGLVFAKLFFPKFGRFIKLNVVSLALTGGAILALLVALGAIVVLPLILSYIGLGGWTEFLLRFLRWPVLLCLVILGLAVLYRFGPSRESPRWEWLTVGSGFAAVAWLVGSALLSWYLANFANYDATYGSLGAAIGMMIWMWISAIVILLGAELNSEIEHQTARDSTTGHERPLGQRGAAMADTVGRRT